MLVTCFTPFTRDPIFSNFVIVTTHILPKGGVLAELGIVCGECCDVGCAGEGALLRMAPVVNIHTLRTANQSI